MINVETQLTKDIKNKVLKEKGYCNKNVEDIIKSSVLFLSNSFYANCLCNESYMDKFIESGNIIIPIIFGYIQILEKVSKGMTKEQMVEEAVNYIHNEILSKNSAA